MTQPAVAPRSMFAIFRKRDFSLMWSAQLISTIGEALTDLAAAILIFRITGSAFAVGAVLMVGGNLKGETQVLTTAIYENTRLGEFSTAIALGLLLLTISFLIFFLLFRFQEGRDVLLRHLAARLQDALHLLQRVVGSRHRVGVSSDPDLSVADDHLRLGGAPDFLQMAVILTKELLQLFSPPDRQRLFHDIKNV